MTEPQFYAYRSANNRLLLQSAETGLVAGLMFPGMPGESLRAFTYDYGHAEMPDQLLNRQNFPELADIPFFTLEGCYWDSLSLNLQESPPILPEKILATWGKSTAFTRSLNPPSPVCDRLIWKSPVPNTKGTWTIPSADLWVNEQGCWVCDRDGQILVLNAQGEPIQFYTLPQGGRRFVTNLEDPLAAPWVSCEDGYLYDLTNKIPQPLEDLRPSRDFYAYLITALTATEQQVFLADAYGNLRAFDRDLRLLWHQPQADRWQGYFLQTQGNILYQGHYHGVSAYDLATGSRHWHQPLASPVLCGCLTSDGIVVACGDRRIYALDNTGDPTQPPPLQAWDQLPEMPYCLILGDQGRCLWVGDWSGAVTQLTLQGQVCQRYDLGAGSVVALGEGDHRLYGCTGQGIVVCVDVA